MANSNYFQVDLLNSGINNPGARTLGRAEYDLGQSAIPVIVAPNGTVSALGVITLGTALPQIYTAAYVYLPAGAIVGGLAGLYFTVFSSTTVGQVSTSYFDASAGNFVPRIPALLVNAVGSGSAYTQVTGSNLPLANVVVPANTLGLNGTLTVSQFTTNNNSAGAKVSTVQFGGSTVLTASTTTAVSLETRKVIKNRGTAAVQFVHPDFILGGTSTVAATQLAINTAVDTNVVFNGKIAVATDYLVLEYMLVQAISSQNN